jgi:hypothetical protein
MSLNAIFRYPDLYQTAIAIAFVSNQRFYDTIYQERYMGLQDDNEQGYKEGSPITFAHQLTQVPQLPIKILIFESKTNKVYTTLFSRSFQQEAISSAVPVQDDAAESPDVQLVDRYNGGVSLCLIL